MMLSRILQWIKDLPTTAKATIGLVGTVIPVILLLRADFRLGLVILSALLVVAALSYLAHVVLAKNRPPVGFTQEGGVRYRYPRHRRWALAGIVAIVFTCALLLLLKPTRGYFFAVLTGSPAVPRADVLITGFEPKSPSQVFEIPNRLRDGLERELRRQGFAGITVETISRPITSQQEAKEIAEQSGGKVVIWGWYDKFGTTIKFYIAEPQPSDEEALQLKPVAWVTGANVDEDISFKIREQLPDDVNFLSLFVIGNLYYLHNQYQRGHQAFDAAMRDMSKESRFENESLLHFFNARSLAAAGPQNAGDAICDYAMAIEMNPRLAAAYNNLGVLIATFGTSMQEQEGYDEDGQADLKVKLPENIKACVDRINPDFATDPSGAFDAALELLPGSAVIQYNSLAWQWRSLGLEPDSTQDLDLVRKLEGILRQDPSVPGAHIMRAVLAFKDKDEDFDDWQSEVALRGFSNASRLLPGSAELHVNLGKVYMRKGRYAEARTEFDRALQLAPRNVEAHLAIADVAIRQGEPQTALQHLAAASSARPEDATAVSMAAVLKARVHFEAGDMSAAIETLRAYLSEHPEPTPTPTAEETTAEDDAAIGDGEGEAAEGGSEIPDVVILAPNDNSLIHYLLGLLYTSASDAASAKPHWDACDVPAHQSDGEPAWEGEARIKAHNKNDTAVVSWMDLLTLCYRESQDPSKWGVAGTCLPQYTKERLMKVFDIAQARITHRLFYRVRRESYYGLACPYVYTFDEGSGRWLFDTTIIYKLNGADLEALQSRPLERFDGKLIVREVEPEVSHLDQIAVVVTDRRGWSHTLRPQLKTLVNADGQYLVLRRGDEVNLTFEGFGLIDRPKSFRIEAKGYYVPLK
jgi:tetratricopeptide (TPR) repeat protein